MPTPSIFLLDGGLGTTLKDSFSASVDGSTRPLWSSHLLISSPETLQLAQTAFASAGADIILTATYQASYEGFANTRVDHVGAAEGGGVNHSDASDYMRSAVKIARNAADRSSSSRGKGMVALSLGAYGAIMVPSQEYSGAYDERHQTVQGLERWHSERLNAFESVWDDVDLVAFETLPLLTEVEAVREVMDKSNHAREQKKFWISCVFPGEEDTMPDGSSIQQLVKAMLGEKEGAAVPYAIGLNCTKTSKVEGLIKQFEAGIDELGFTERPALIVYPDGTRGEVYNTTNHEWEMKEDNKNMLAWDSTIYNIVEETVERGKWSAILVGGCCKTSPAEIAALRRRLDDK